MSKWSQEVVSKLLIDFGESLDNNCEFSKNVSVKRNNCEEEDQQSAAPYDGLITNQPVCPFMSSFLL